MKLRDRLPKIIPIAVIASFREDLAIAQTTQQPPQQLPPPSASDPVTVYGVGIALALSLGQVIVGLFKKYAETVGKKSDIEIARDQAEQQRNQDILGIVVAQQKVYVEDLRQENRDLMAKLLLLIKESNEAQHRTAEAIESLTNEIKRGKS